MVPYVIVRQAMLPHESDEQHQAQRLVMVPKHVKYIHFYVVPHLTRLQKFYSLEVEEVYLLQVLPDFQWPASMHL